jgi:CubicO group peptidase (beta-lactamase class C family)
MSGGLSKERLGRLVEAMKQDIAKDLYFGGVVIVARHGEIGLCEAFGDAGPEVKKPVKQDSVFSLFSVTKAFTNVLMFRAIERGEITLTTKVKDVIPEFAGHGRDDINYFHLITHSSGLPSVWIPRPGMYIDRLDDIIAGICERVFPEVPPGVRVDYSPLCSHALMGESVRRVDVKGRSYRDLVQQEILDPLKMTSTSVGLRADLRERHLMPDFRGKPPMEHLGHSNLGPQGAFLEEHAEMPWVGVASTAPDMFRFAEMLRRGGELDGKRILGPVILKQARKVWTGDKPNELYRKMAEERGWPIMPAYLGLGFSLRGEAIGNTLFGTLASPETFGNYGAGSTFFWVDPELDMTFVGLTTGVMNSADNIQRWGRLSDMAVAAAL